MAMCSLALANQPTIKTLGSLLQTHLMSTLTCLRVDGIYAMQMLCSQIDGMMLNAHRVE